MNASVSQVSVLGLYLLYLLGHFNETQVFFKESELIKVCFGAGLDPTHFPEFLNTLITLIFI